MLYFAAVLIHDNIILQCVRRTIISKVMCSPSQYEFLATIWKASISKFHISLRFFIGGVFSRSTSIPRIQQLLSPHPNWDPPPHHHHHLSRKQVFPGVGVHTRLRVRGWGSPNSDNWRKAYHSSLLSGFFHRGINIWTPTLVFFLVPTKQLQSNHEPAPAIQC
jgi:hypothetical protein